MIFFEYIRWRNFLSTGNAFTEINLSQNRSTLIVGENGAGKSTILDALTFALYGKPFRKVNKPLLINAINQKNLEVEVQFRIGKRKYLVRRGIKPNIFEIYQDDILINQDADSKEYQELFERNILKLNHKSFSQIVILGSASFVPFMQLSAANRREVIEDLLDIQVFSTMNGLLKERIQDNKDKINKADFNIKLFGEKIEMFNKHINAMKLNNDTVIQHKRAKIDEINEEIKTATTYIETNKNVLNNLYSLTADADKIRKKSKKLVTLGDQLEVKIDRIKDEINFFLTNDNCPTCKQGIEHDHRNSIDDKNKESLKELVDGKKKIDEELVKLNNKLTDIMLKEAEISKINQEVSGQQIYISLKLKHIQELNEEIVALQQDSGINDRSADELRQLKYELKASIAERESLGDEKSVLDVAQVLLKDTGIKTKIIKQYIPIINKLINKYLAAMDFFVNFQLNESFEEKIRSRHRDEFSYESFSEGEKLRIDLSLLFTWRAVAKLRNSASTNLLIMDEVFDSSLDASGTDEFLKLLGGLTNDTNVFIISHKGDTLFDKFDNIIKFEKVKNFSRISA